MEYEMEDWNVYNPEMGMIYFDWVSLYGAYYEDIP